MSEGDILNKTWDNALSTSLNSIGGYTVGQITDWYYPVIREYYPIYYGNWTVEKNKTEQAFKIVQALMEKKIIEVLSVKDFIELTNKIVELL
jgi:hypothetical protein